LIVQAFFFGIYFVLNSLCFELVHFGLCQDGLVDFLANIKALYDQLRVNAEIVDRIFEIINLCEVLKSLKEDQSLFQNALTKRCNDGIIESRLLAYNFSDVEELSIFHQSELFLVNLEALCHVASESA